MMARSILHRSRLAPIMALALTIAALGSLIIASGVNAAGPTAAPTFYSPSAGTVIRFHNEDPVTCTGNDPDSIADDMEEIILDGSTVSEILDFAGRNSRLLPPCGRGLPELGPEIVVKLDVMSESAIYKIAVHPLATDGSATPVTLFLATCGGGDFEQYLWNDARSRGQAACAFEEPLYNGTTTHLFAHLEYGGVYYLVIDSSKTETPTDSYLLQIQVAGKTEDSDLVAKVADSITLEPSDRVVQTAQETDATCVNGLPSTFVKPYDLDLDPGYDRRLEFLDFIDAFPRELFQICANASSETAGVESIVAFTPTRNGTYALETLLPGKETAFAVTLAHCSGGLLYQTNIDDALSGEARPRCNAHGLVARLHANVTYYFILQLGDPNIPRTLLQSLAVQIKAMNEISEDNVPLHILEATPHQNAIPLVKSRAVKRNNGNSIACTAEGIPILVGTGLAHPVRPEYFGDELNGHVDSMFGGYPSEIDGCGASSASGKETLFFIDPHASGKFKIKVYNSASYSPIQFVVSVARCQGGTFYEAISLDAATGTIVDGCKKGGVGEDVEITVNLIKGVHYYIIVDTIPQGLNGLGQLSYDILVTPVEAIESGPWTTGEAFPEIVPPLGVQREVTEESRVVKRAKSQIPVGCSSTGVPLLQGINKLHPLIMFEDELVFYGEMTGEKSEIEESCKPRSKRIPSSTNERILWFVPEESGTWTIDAHNSEFPMTIILTYCSGEKLYEAEYVDANGVTAKACSADELRGGGARTRLVIPLIADVVYYIIIKNAPSVSSVTVTATFTSASLEAPKSPNGEGEPSEVSSGAIIGIAIGAAFVIAGVLTFAVLKIKRREQQLSPRVRDGEKADVAGNNAATGTVLVAEPVYDDKV